VSSRASVSSHAADSRRDTGWESSLQCFCTIYTQFTPLRATICCDNDFFNLAIRIKEVIGGMEENHLGTARISDAGDKMKGGRVKRIWVVLFLVALVLASAGTASALLFTLDSYNVKLLEEDPGLVLYWTPILDAPISHDFAVGESRTVDLFRIGTSERWSNDDDRVHKDIGVTFDFSAPDILAGIEGQSWGNSFQFFCWGLSWGNVAWDDPVLFEFGDGGEFSIDLSNAWFPTPGSSVVTATFTYETAPSGSFGTTGDTASPVPEPSTILLVGAGLLGLAGLGRKRCRLKRR
jgi:hypothetical protein